MFDVILWFVIWLSLVGIVTFIFVYGVPALLNFFMKSTNCESYGEYCKGEHYHGDSRPSYFTLCLLFQFIVIIPLVALMCYAFATFVTYAIDFYIP